MVYGGGFIHPNILLHGAIEFDAEFKRANSKEAGHIVEGREGNLVRWNPLPKGKYKTNWNVAVDIVNGCLGTRFIVRDHNG